MHDAWNHEFKKKIIINQLVFVMQRSCVVRVVGIGVLNIHELPVSEEYLD